jgi:hypothetical protein
MARSYNDRDAFAVSGIPPGAAFREARMIHPSAVCLVFLTDIVRRLLGVPANTLNYSSDVKFFLARPGNLGVSITILAVATIWFGYIYYRDGTRPSWLIKGPLVLLRLIAVSALFIMLMQPMLRIHQTERVRSNAVLLVDDSMSMSFKDSRLPSSLATRLNAYIGADPKSLTRAQILERLANKPSANTIGILSQHYNVKLYKFSSEPSLEALPSGPQKAYNLRVQPSERRGASTQIGSALKKALDDLAGQQVAGALIMSDGGNNLGDDPVAVAEQAKRQGVTVSTLGIGDPTPTKDISITEVLADQVVRKDNVVQVFAGISSRGYAGRNVSVQLRRGGQTISVQTIRLGDATQKQTVAFTFTPKQEGSFTYTVSISPQPEEVTDRNNQRSFIQRVTSKKLRILYVESEPRWEYRYLKNAILRDTQIRFSCILTSSTFKSGGEGNVPIFAFPTDDKALFDYDIVIIGDVAKGYFNDAQIRNIRRFVEEKGGSLVVICGEKHMPQDYRSSSLEAVFPVVLPPVAEQVKTSEPFHLELTESGRQDPVLRLSESPADSARAWRDLPGMHWNAGVERAKPGATVLAVNPDRSNAYGKRVAIAVNNFGAGRCFFSTIDSTWRWRWRIGDRYFYRYWGQVIRTLTPHEAAGGNRFSQVNSDKSDYMLGERVSFHARLLDAFYRPIAEKQVVASLTGESGAPGQLILTAVPGSPGLYSGETMADRTGKFELSLASPANPSAKSTATYLVQSVSLESQQPEMNEGLLRKIAGVGGGRFYSPVDVRKWIDSLKANDLIIRNDKELELWDAPLFLFFFIVPLTIEWVMRKRTGLL